MSLIHNVKISQEIAVSTLNSTSANIAGLATWSGTAEDIVDFTGIQTIFIADKDCTLYMEQGIDGSNWIISDSWTVLANTGDARSFVSVAPYFRVRITNNSVQATTSLNLAVGLSPILNVLPRKLLEQGGLFTTTNQNVVADPINSTEIALNAGQTFTGAAVSTLGVVGIQISMKADQNAIVYVDQSPNGVHWDIVDLYNYYTSKNFGLTVQAVNSYYRIRITNNTSQDMTYLRFQTALCPMVEAVPRSLDSEQAFITCVQDIEGPMGKVIMSPMGALKTAQTYRLAGASFIGSTIDTNFWTTAVTGNGAVTQVGGELTLTTGTPTANGSALINTTKVGRYIPPIANFYRGNINAPAVTTAVAGHSCTRRFGAFDANDGFFFELYQVQGSSQLLRVVSRKNGSDTQVSNGSFSGDHGSTYIIDTNIHTYEIWWNNKNTYFFIDGTILHTLTGTTTTLTQTLGLKVGLQVVNAGGNTAANTLVARSSTINRLGDAQSGTTYRYIAGALAATVLKYGAGKLHTVVNNKNTGNSITLYDSLTNTNQFAIIDPARILGPIQYDLEFSTGLTVVTAGAVDCTIIYE
jgi:hypothetical protein